MLPCPAHRTLMLPAKQNKNTHKLHLTGPPIPLGFGAGYYRVCGVSAIGLLSLGSSLCTRIIILPLLVLAGLELGSEQLLYWVQMYVRSGLLGIQGSSTCSFGKLGREGVTLHLSSASGLIRETAHSSCLAFPTGSSWRGCP